MTQPPDTRQFAPATQRNREPILAVLQRILPPTGTVFEISSGTGEHAIFLAPNLHPRQWLPSDPDPIARASIIAWSHDCPAENLHPPLAIDAREKIWAIERPDVRDRLSTLDLEQHPIQAIANINMIHIAPWAACLGLMAGAERLLPSGGVLYLYGPFKQNGQHTAPSNEAFDGSLRWQNPEWGVRDLEEVVAIAQNHQLTLTDVIPMPANNFSVVFHKA
ncbi:MAG: DUF938 domain-containing protein [Cyanobacteria bacterium J06638_22]